MPTNALVTLPTIVVIVSDRQPGTTTYRQQLQAAITSRLTTTGRRTTSGTDSDLIVWIDVYLRDCENLSFRDALDRLRSEHNTVRRAQAAAHIQPLDIQLTFRAIVICDILEHTVPVFSALERIALALTEAHAGEVQLQLAAVLLHTGTTPAAPGAYSFYARATTQAAGGALLQPDQVREAAQHLIFTLLTAPRMWQNLAELGKHKHWIAFGSAAVIMQQNIMEEYAYSASLKTATKHLAAIPAAAELARIRPHWSALQDHNKWLEHAEHIMKAHGYQRDSGTPAATAPFIYTNGATSPDYALLSADIRTFAEAAVTEYLETLKAKINSQLGSSTPLNGSAAGPLAEAAQSRLPDGLPGLRAMLAETKDQLSGALLLTDKETADAPGRYLFTGAVFFNELADSIAEANAARALRLERISRNVLHPLTQMLWLIPAAICIRAMLLVYLPLPPLAPLWAGAISAGRSSLSYWAAAVAFCLMLGVAEAWYWTVVLTKWRTRLQRETLLAAGRQAVCVVNQALWQAHASVTRALDNTILATTHLTRLLNTELDLATENITAARIQPTEFFRTYKLANFNQCDACIKEALQEIGIDQTNSLSALLSNNSFGGLHGHWHISRAFDGICDRIRSATEAKLDTNYLGLNALIIQHEPLNAGKLWPWLVERAKPLSPAQAGSTERIFFVSADVALFAGADGGREILAQCGYQSNSYTNISSNLDCEIVCIRGFVDAPIDEQRPNVPATTPTPRRTATR